MTNPPISYRRWIKWFGNDVASFVVSATTILFFSFFSSLLPSLFVGFCRYWYCLLACFCPWGIDCWLAQMHVSVVFVRFACCRRLLATWLVTVVVGRWWLSVVGLSVFVRPSVRRHRFPKVRRKLCKKKTNSITDAHVFHFLIKNTKEP